MQRHNLDSAAAGRLQEVLDREEAGTHGYLPDHLPLDPSRSAMDERLRAGGSSIPIRTLRRVSTRSPRYSRLISALSSRIPPSHGARLAVWRPLAAGVAAPSSGRGICCAHRT